MAQLQWRDVNAPDFSGSAEGFRTFSNLLDSAFGGLKQSVNQFDATQTNRVNQELMRTAMGITDAAAFEAALPGMLQDPRAARLTAENLAALGSRTNALLQTEGNRLQNTNMSQDMDFQQLERGRTQDDWKAEDAVQPYANEAMQLVAAGNDEGARAVWARPEARAALSQLDPDKARAIVSGEFQIGSDRRQIRNSDLTYDSSLFDFNEKKTTAAERSQAESVLADLLPRATTLQEAEGLIYNSETYKALPVGARLAADSMIRARFPNAAPAIAGAGGGGNVAPSAPGTGGSWAQRVGLVGSESGGNYGALNSEGYGGRLQFGAERLADAAAAGLVPRGTTGAQFARMAPETQDAVEEWHFRNIDEQAAAAGITAYNGQTIGGVRINQNSIRAMAHLGGVDGVRRFVETGGRYNPADSNGTRLSDYGQRFGAPSLDVLINTGNAAQSQIADQRAQSPVEDLLAGYAAANRQNLAPAAAAASLIGDGGALQGANRADAIEAIENVATRYGVTNSVAAALISNNVRRPGVIDFRRRMGGVVLDHDGIKKDADLLKDGGLQRATVALQSREGVSANIQAATANAQAAASALAGAIEQQRRMPDYDISAFYRRDQQARQALAMAQAASQAPGVGYQPPVAPAAPVRPVPPARRPDNQFARREGETAEAHRARVNGIIAATPPEVRNAPTRRPAARPAAPAAPVRGVNDYARRQGETAAAHRIRVRAMMGL